MAEPRTGLSPHHRGHPAHRPAACLFGKVLGVAETQHLLANGTVGLFPEAPPGTVVVAPEGSGEARPAAYVWKRAEAAASPGSSSAVCCWGDVASLQLPQSPPGPLLPIGAPLGPATCMASHSPTRCPLLRTHPEHLAPAGTLSTWVGRIQTQAVPHAGRSPSWMQ